MARDVSNDIKRQISRHPAVLFRRATFPIRLMTRQVLARATTPPIASESAALICDLPDLSPWEQEFRDRGFVFVPDFMGASIWEELVNAWPSRRWFRPMSWKEKTKTYDQDFRSVHGRPEVKVHRFPILSAIYNMLNSAEFSERLTSLAGDEIRRTCISIVANRATWGTALAPHRDSFDARTNFESYINIIYFVTAKGEPLHAGATSFYRTNNFSKVVFTPPSLINSALIYKSNHDLFHGFPPMGIGTSRSAITAHYGEAVSP